MKIIVAGGHGFVGTYVHNILKNSVHEVSPLSKRDGFNLLDYNEIAKSLKGAQPDVIINCAAHTGSLHYVTAFAADVIDDNVQMTLNLYRAVKNHCPNAKIVNPLSNCSYPGKVDVQIESQWWDGPVHDSVWSYGNAKRMIGVISKCYAMQYKIRSVNFLVPNAYGPGDSIDPNKTHALNGMIIRMLQSKKEGVSEFEIWGTGKPAREWIYVEDIAKILIEGVHAIEDQITPVNIAQYKAYTIYETAKMIKELTGYNGELMFNTKYQDGAPMKILDDTMFRQQFPSFVFKNIYDGIKDTVQYYKHVLNLS